jgi:hypothetical protein
VDVCTKDPGKEVDVYFTSTVKTMADIRMGLSNYKKAQREGDIKIVGNSHLTRNITSWMKNSIFADLPPASEI